MEHLRVTALELPARWGVPEDAIAGVDAVLAEGPRTDLVLLPEASLTGYVSPAGDFDLRRFAEPEPTAERVQRRTAGRTSHLLAELARRHGVNLVAPLVVSAPDAEGAARFYNAMVSFDAQGELRFVYRKRHPWIPERWATSGASAPPVVRICHASVTICICYDIHFVGGDAADELDRADVLLFPTAWVDDGDDDLRDALLPDLARRHRVAIVNSNWSAGVVRVPGQGASRILDATGRELARSPGGEAGRIARLDATLALPR